MGLALIVCLKSAGWGDRGYGHFWYWLWVVIRIVFTEEIQHLQALWDQFLLRRAGYLMFLIFSLVHLRYFVLWMFIWNSVEWIIRPTETFGYLIFITLALTGRLFSSNLNKMVQLLPNPNHEMILWCNRYGINSLFGYWLCCPLSHIQMYLIFWCCLTMFNCSYLKASHR